MTKRRLATGLATAALALTLAACAVTIMPDHTISGQVVVRPAPVRPAAIEWFASQAASYWIGDQVRFHIRTRGPGYVTLTAFDPDGSVYVIARNVPVAGNRLEVIPSPAGRVSFVATAPTGRHMVRAHFTPERTSERVVFVGIRSLDTWMAQIVLEIRAYGYGAEDVAETRFDVRR